MAKTTEELVQLIGQLETDRVVIVIEEFAPNLLQGLEVCIPVESSGHHDEPS